MLSKKGLRYIIQNRLRAGDVREAGHAAKVIIETTAYTKALVKLEEKSPDTN
jgi:hypothetical protein